MSVLLVHLGFAASDEGEQTLLLARALRDAAALDPRVKGVPSTKGVL